jgi:hypothetical protein
MNSEAIAAINMKVRTWFMDDDVDRKALVFNRTIGMVAGAATPCYPAAHDETERRDGRAVHAPGDWGQGAIATAPEAA